MGGGFYGHDQICFVHSIVRLSIALHWARGNLRDSDLLFFEKGELIRSSNSEAFCIYIATLRGRLGFRKLVSVSSHFAFMPGFCGYIFRTTHPRILPIIAESGGEKLYENPSNPYDVRYYCTAEGSQLLRLAYAEKNKKEKLKVAQDKIFQAHVCSS